MRGTDGVTAAGENCRVHSCSEQLRKFCSSTNGIKMTRQWECSDLGNLGVDGRILLRWMLMQ